MFGFAEANLRVIACKQSHKNIQYRHNSSGLLIEVAPPSYAESTLLDNFVEENRLQNVSRALLIENRSLAVSLEGDLLMLVDVFPQIIKN